jgi:glycosyltransferase involved in cell wall biosynthesis
VKNNAVTVSVVLPVYNGGEFLTEAIESILGQSHIDFELIIIDDGSTDRSLSIINRFAGVDARIRVVSRENRGLVSSLNEGFKLCTGKYIARMDADDISSPDRFFEQVAKLEETGADFCGCHFFVVDEKSAYLEARVVSCKEFLTPIILSRSTPFAHGSVLIRREFLVNSALEYDATFCTFAEDYCLWVQCFMAGGRFVNCDKFLFTYRELDSSLSTKHKKKNVKDSYVVSTYMIRNLEKGVFDSALEVMNSSNVSFGTFELEQIAYFVFRTFFGRKITLNYRYLVNIPLTIIFVGFLRALKCVFRVK